MIDNRILKDYDYEIDDFLKEIIDIIILFNF